MIRALKHFGLVIFFTALTVAAGVLLSKFPPAKIIDNLIYDACVRYFAPPSKVSDKIVVVLLDEETMRGLPYRSPVPRDFLYELNEKLLSAKPAAIGYDIFFKDPTFEKIDARLAASFKKGNVFAVTAGKIDQFGKWYEDEPLDLFKDSLKGTGLADLPFSASDTSVRTAKFEFDYSGVERPSFVAAIYDFATGGNAEALIHDPARSLSIFGIKFPPQLNDITRIRFVGLTNRFQAYPAKFIQMGYFQEEWFKDKIVLVGAAYEDGTDAYITPFYSSRYHYERMPGVLIHANALNQLLTRQFYFEVPKYLTVAGLIILGFLSALFFLYGPIWRGVTALVIFSALLVIKIVVNFHLHGLVIPFVPYEGAMLLTFGTATGFRSFTEGRQKRFIKGVFAKYVPPSVVDKMIADPKLLTLGGEQREVSCLFTDIASFTTISEKLDPKTLVTFLNEYLDKLTRAVFKHGGTLDKYEGDAIIAFFGAPLSLPDHRSAAIHAAIEMQKESNFISEKWSRICGREIQTRIGINSGNAVVGNMGSDLRFDYTVIGDVMNLASRLEGANKFFGTNILASENSVRSLEAIGDIIFRPVANVKVKGKEQAVKVYEVIGLVSDTDDETIKRIKEQPEQLEVIELKEKT